MRFLVDASAALSESLDERATLDTLARLAIAGLADGCMVTLVREGGALEHVATVSRDDDVTARLAAETERLYPLPTDAPSGYPHVIRTGEPELVPEGAFDDQVLPSVAVDERHLARLRQLRMYSGMVVPLVARGSVLGAITLVLFGEEHRRPFDAEDLALATELGRRAALAVDNARLFAAERSTRAAAAAAADRVQALADASRAFAEASTDPRRLMDELARICARRVGDMCIVRLLSDDGRTLEPVAAHHPEPEVERELTAVTLTTPLPMGEGLTGRIAREGVTLLIPVAAPHEVALSVPRTFRAYAERHPMRSVLGVPIVASGRVAGTLLMAREAEDQPYSHDDLRLVQDIADRAALVLERARLFAAERQARGDAERANRAKSELLAKVSHETRQPVHATIGWVDLLEMELSGPLTAAQRDALRRVTLNQRRLLSVLNDLLDFSRVQAGKLELVVRDVSISEIVDHVESAVAPQFREKEVQLTLCRADEELSVRADADQLIGILTNLLGNAVKFTPVGGDVRLLCESDERRVRLSVRDTGLGIPPELHERVFEPFFQVESGFTRTAAGTGLGLAISREAARAMGGDIVLDSEPGLGSVFTVILPRGARSL